MPAITLANLRLRVRERCGMEDSEFVADAELNAIVNGEAAELHDLLVGAYEDQFTTSLDFTISSGSTYAVASTIYKLRGLDISEGGDWRPLQRFEWNSRARGAYPRSYGGRDVRYRLVGSTIHFSPPENALGTYRLWYVPGYVDLALDADVLEYPQNWHEYVITGSAAKCLAKEESDPGVQLALKDQLRRRIEAMAANRDASGPERVERVRNRSDYEDEW